MGILTVKAVEKFNEPKLYPDGNGLYIQVRSATNKSWLFRYSFERRAREMGLGRYPEVGLAKARELHAKYRSILKDPENPRDPIEVRNEQRDATRKANLKAISFSEATEEYIVDQRAGWRNNKSEQAWRNTLTTYAFPYIGKTPVDEIDVQAVLSVLKPIWSTHNETANRVRSRIERILAWAKTAKNLASTMGQNPAVWRNNLDQVLAKPSKVQSTKHHPSLPADQMPKFWETLDSRIGTAALALRFMILTGTRTNEVIEATWQEFDLIKREWNIPKERMKADQPHRVPLSDQAIAVLEEAEQLDGTYVFPAEKKPQLSTGAMLQLIKRMNKAKILEDGKGWVDIYGDRIVPHGFRATFREWGGESADFSYEVLEHALAHKVGDKSAQAYDRGDMFKKRIKLMDAWATYCTTKTS